MEINKKFSDTDLMTAKEAATYLRCTPRHIYTLIGAKAISVIKISNRKILIHKTHLDTYLDEHLVEATNRPICRRHADVDFS